MRSGIFAVGAVILVLGLIPMLVFGSFTGSVESMFGGWAMLSEEYQKWRIYVSIGQIMAVIGIIIMIPGIILRKYDRDKKKSIYFCEHCKFAASTEAELYNHSVKEHNDESRFAGKAKGEDESTFKYKDEEIQPDTSSDKVLPKKPKRDLKKSPTLKGIIIGIIAVSIIYSAIWGLFYQSFVVSNDNMAPTLHTFDVVRYVKTPFHEIQVNDIIFYSDPSDPKTWVHKVISVDRSVVPYRIIVKSEASNALHFVPENQYIGKLDSVIKGGGYIGRMLDPTTFVLVLLAAFVTPIVIMKIRERKIHYLR